MNPLLHPKPFDKHSISNRVFSTIIKMDYHSPKKNHRIRNLIKPSDPEAFMTIIPKPKGIIHQGKKPKKPMIVTKIEISKITTQGIHDYT